MKSQPDQSGERLLQMCRDTQQTLVIASRMISATYKEIAQLLEQRDREVHQLRQRLEMLETLMGESLRTGRQPPADPGCLWDQSELLPSPASSDCV